ncbi:hypothetical protein L1049_019183 [Liquidambar formosana]|uniref:Uncharacterized protein n=1 Tax=Liquidambar formosana TaxID=63359 RepID=A0AAP0RB58_LIQFO
MADPKLVGKLSIIIEKSHNDINVFYQSLLFADLANGCALLANYIINGYQYTIGYYLVDGIYPPQATLVQTISAPIGASKHLFSKMQKVLKGRGKGI